MKTGRVIIGLKFFILWPNKQRAHSVKSDNDGTRDHLVALCAQEEVGKVRRKDTKYIKVDVSGL